MRWGKVSKSLSPKAAEISGEVSGNFLSALFASTLKVVTSSNWSFKYTGAKSNILSISFSVTAAREKPAIPKT